MWSLAVLYLAVVNALTFAAFAIDKRRAINAGRRVPERVLLNLAAVGGAPGAMAAQRLLRHKTRKEPFRTLLLVIWIVQALALAGLLAWYGLRPPAG